MSQNSLDTKYKYLNELPPDSLQLLLDNEIVKKEKNYELITNLSIAIKNKTADASASIDLSSKSGLANSHSAQTETQKKNEGMIHSLRFKLTGQTRRNFYLLCFAVALYVGIWFFRFVFFDSNGGVYFDQPVWIRTFLGFFTLISVITYSSFYLLKLNYQSTVQFDSKVSDKVLSLLGISTVIDLGWLVFDAGWFSFINIYYITALITASLALKFYAFTLFFRRKSEDNFFVENNIGIVSRLSDYQFLVWLLSICVQFILGISLALVYAYNVEDLKPEEFFFLFLFPFSTTFVALALTLYYFDFNKKISEQSGVFFRVLWTTIVTAISFFTIPIAVIFFIFHSLFLFTKVFDIENLSNPTITLSQIYVGLTLLALISFLAIRILKPFKLNSTWEKLYLYSTIFHVSYSIIGVIFALIGMTIRVLNYDFTSNRIFGYLVLFLELISLGYIWLRLVELKKGANSSSEKSNIDGVPEVIKFQKSRYNEIYKVIYIAPVIVSVMAWLLYSIIQYDQRTVKSIIKNENIREFITDDYGNNYIVSTINSDINSIPLDYDTQKIKVVNQYLRDSDLLGQTFILFNVAGINSYEDLNFDIDLKELVRKNRDNSGYKLTPDYGRYDGWDNEDIKSCKEDFKKLFEEYGYDMDEVYLITETWNSNYFTSDFRDQRYYSYSYSYDYYNNQFWRECITD